MCTKMGYGPDSTDSLQLHRTAPSYNYMKNSGNIAGNILHVLEAWFPPQIGFVFGIFLGAIQIKRHERWKNILKYTGEIQKIKLIVAYME